MLLVARNVLTMVFVLNALKIMTFVILTAQVLKTRFMTIKALVNACLNVMRKINMKLQHLILDS